MAKERIYGIDLVRVCALILILVYHFNTYGAQLKLPFISQNSMGAVGVGLYLLISGTVLAYNYNGKFKVGEFYKKRMITLMLPFWIAYIMVYVFNWVTGIKPVDLPLWKYIYTLIGMDGYLSYKIPTFYLIGEWFLGFIIICYILFPLFNICVQKIPWILATVTGILFLYNITTYQWTIPMLWNPLILTPFFVLGIYFMQYIYPHIKIEIFLASLLGAYACDKFIFTNIMNDILVGTFLLFVSVFYIGKFLQKVKFKVVFEKLSKYSWGIILFHHVTMNNLYNYLGEEWFISSKKYITLFLVCAISLGLAVLLNRLVKLCISVAGSIAAKLKAGESMKQYGEK